MVHLTSSRRSCIPRSKFEVDHHDEFISRIKKTLYYGRQPLMPRFSLPVSELASEFFTEVKHDHCIQSLDLGEAAAFSRKACVSPCALVLALLYLDRLKKQNPDYIRRVGPSELFVVSLMVASKFLHDDGEEDEVLNDKWASLAGIDTEEINRSERDFLHAIGWEVYVSVDSFWKQHFRLEKIIALREGKKRGWFSYTDLNMLMEHLHLATIAHTLITVSAVCLTSYTACVMTVVGSVLVANHVTGPNLVSLLSSRATNLPVHNDSDFANPMAADSLRLDLPLLSFIHSSIVLNSVESCNETDIWAEADIHHFENESMGHQIKTKSMGLTIPAAVGSFGDSTCLQHNGGRWREKHNLTKNWIYWEGIASEESVEVPCTVLSTNR